MKHLLLLPLLFIVTTCFSQRQTIQLHLSVGKTYSHYQQNKTRMIQTINGEDHTFTMEIRAQTSYFIRSAHDSVYEMMVRYDKLSTITNAGQGDIEYSSDRSKQDLMSKIFQAMVHQPFLVVMTKHGRIVEMHIDSLLTAAVSQMPGLSTQQKEAIQRNLQKSFGGEASKGSFEMITAIYPYGPVALNSSWAIKTKPESIARMDLNCH